MHPDTFIDYTKHQWFTIALIISQYYLKRILGGVEMSFSESPGLPIIPTLGGDHIEWCIIWDYHVSYIWLKKYIHPFIDNKALKALDGGRGVLIYFWYY